ncbi:FG-GAP repeat domain-containing protein [Cystobacter fuscus]
MAFGPSRLLRNLLRETGSATFEDVTTHAGVGDHSVSLAVTMLDFDRDGHLDFFVANALTTHLPDYATPTPFNFFHLPAPEYPGDRRMLRFMHNGWHDADNGGLNALYRGRGDGTFEKLDSAAMGLKETRWSLAVSTVDLNQDGWTDLYIANDFGPDEIYLNEQGKHFRRIRGALFGDIGKDTYKGMNASVADFDRNGWLDVYVSNVHHSLQAEGSLLWMVSRDRSRSFPRSRTRPPSGARSTSGASAGARRRGISTTMVGQTSCRPMATLMTGWITSSTRAARITGTSITS